MIGDINAAPKSFTANATLAPPDEKSASDRVLAHVSTETEKWLASGENKTAGTFRPEEDNRQVSVWW